MAVKVQVLYSEGCMRTPLTIDRIHEVAGKAGIDIELTTEEVYTLDQVLEWNFLGSPTVRVNGKDIDPAARGAVFQGFT